MVKRQIPAATRAALPPEEPPAALLGLWGFLAVPCAMDMPVMPAPASWQLALPTKMAPASLKALMQGASPVGARWSAICIADWSRSGIGYACGRADTGKAECSICPDQRLLQNQWVLSLAADAVRFQHAGCFAWAEDLVILSDSHIHHHVLQSLTKAVPAVVA